MPDLSLVKEIASFIEESCNKDVPLWKMISSCSVDHHAGKVMIHLNLSMSEELFYTITHREET